MQQEAKSGKGVLIPILGLKDRELEKALAVVRERVLHVIPDTLHCRIRIISLHHGGEKGGLAGYETYLNEGMLHVEDVLTRYGYEVVWPPFGLVNGPQRCTKEIWIRYQNKGCQCSARSEIPDCRGYAEPAP